MSKPIHVTVDKIIKAWDLFSETKDEDLIDGIQKAVKEAYLRGCVDGKKDSQLFKEAKEFCKDLDKYQAKNEV